MDKEKEIEEMTKAVMCAMEYREKTGTPNFELIAQNLANAGYGNIGQAVREFAERLKEELWKLDGSWQEYDGEELCETVDNLITELYGADE